MRGSDIVGTPALWFVVGVGGVVVLLILGAVVGGGIGVGTWQLSNGKHTRDQANYMKNVVAPAADESLHNSSKWDPGAHH
jgi:hypothetical protein